MEVFPATLVFAAIVLFQIFRDLDNATALAIVFLPLGMFAVVGLPSLGGLSLVASSVLGMLAVGLAVAGSAARRQNTGTSWRLGPGIVPLACFTAYAVFSSTVLVNLFAGDFYVFPLSRVSDGVRVDFGYPSVVAPLAPSTSNLSQAMYICLSFGFFVVVMDWIRRRGIQSADSAIRVAAWIHIGLALLDALNVNQILGFIRTANYALASEHTLGGFERIIGGFPEPSTFGSVSAAFFAYFFFSFLYMPSPRNISLAGLNFLCVIVSFSATAYISSVAVIILLAWHARTFLFEEHARDKVYMAIGMSALILAVACAIFVFSPAQQHVRTIIDALFIGKTESLSGIERGAWARSGIQAFFESKWLGAGAGSLRANGLLPVMLGSVGLPGLITFLLFVFAVAWGQVPKDPGLRCLFVSAQAAVLAQIAAAFVAATVPDLGLFFFTFAAIAASAKQLEGLRNSAARERTGNRPDHYGAAFR